MLLSIFDVLYIICLSVDEYIAAGYRLIGNKI